MSGVYKIQGERQRLDLWTTTTFRCLGCTNSIPEGPTAEYILFTNTGLHCLVATAGASIGKTAIAAADTAIVRLRSALGTPCHITAIEISLTDTSGHTWILATGGEVFDAAIA